MRRIQIGALVFTCLTGCGGGSSGDVALPAPIPLPGPTGVQSPGGIWFGRDSGAEQVSFYIAETGELRAFMNPDGGAFASFGAGSVSVAINDVINGSFELGGAVSLPTFEQSEDLGCAISGSVRERLSLSVDVTCSDSVGVVYEEALTLFYDGRSYERESSLDAIAGDYTLDFQTNTNSLNISSDGTISGMYHNGAHCAVNGTAAIIDGDYGLIDISWTMTACIDPFGIYEGVQMSGFALADPAPGAATGRYYFLLTGQTEDGVYSISVLYDPV